MPGTPRKPSREAATCEADHDQRIEPQERPILQLRTKTDKKLELDALVAHRISDDWALAIAGIVMLLVAAIATATGHFVALAVVAAILALLVLFGFRALDNSAFL